MNIVGRRNLYFLLSLAIILPGMLSMAFLGFRLGIDFAGGDQYNLAFTRPIQATAVQKEMDTFNVEATVQQAGPNGVLITTKPLSSAQETTVRADLAQKFPLDPARSSYAQVGPTIARELVVGAGGLIAIASILIVIYLSIRFNYKFAICAILSITLVLSIQPFLTIPRQQAGVVSSAENDEVTKILHSLVADNEALRKSNSELQSLLAESRESLLALQDEAEEHHASSGRLSLKNLSAGA